MQSFTYDELNRLARAETTNTNLWGNTYSYDIWGNLHAKNQIAGKQQGEYFQQTMNAQNQFAGWSYDAAGNLLNDGAHNYQFDAEGRIKCMDAGANCASPAASYVYSVEGRRVKRTVGATTWYAHDGGSTLSEFSNPSQTVGTWQKDYIYLNGALLATESATDGTRFHFSDHLGTPRVITDATGAVLSRHDYYPYGMELTPWSDGESHKFTGKERDSESGLDFFGARYFSSQFGRFNSIDPFNPILELRPESEDEEDIEEARNDFNEYIENPQNWNRYTYALNGPLKYVDVDGRVPVVVVVVIAVRLAPVAGAIAARYGPQVLRTLQTAGPAISQRLYSLGPAVRGGVVELLRGSPNSFRFTQVIDNFRNGIATSVKSIDIFAKSYQNLSNLVSRLSGFVSQLANYRGGLTPAGQIRAGQITGRTLQIVLPKGQLTAEQLKVLADVAREAARQGVRVEYYQIK